MFKTVVNEAESEIEVKKSRFIGYMFPIETEEEFLLMYDEIKRRNNKANHYCYGYRCKGASVIERYNDDREPTMTAGFPILDILAKNELINCAIVVVRYFGGTKLGTGGLSRAYGEAAVKAMGNTQVVEVEKAIHICSKVNYQLSGKFENIVKNHKVDIKEIQYTEQVIYDIYIKRGKVELVKAEVMETLAGSISILLEEEEMGYFINDIFYNY